MPTILTVNGFRFFFYSGDRNEPIHIHVTKGKATGKIWLEPEIRIAYMVGFNNKEIKEIGELVKNNNKTFKTKWNEYFA